MAFRYRPAGIEDAAVIADFNCRLARETENRELPAETVLRGVQRGLQQGDEVQYWVAEQRVDQTWRVVGQLMLTREWSDWRDGWMVWLQSVYVISDVRRQGVFRQLLDNVTQRLRQDDDVVVLRLYVEHDNLRAMETYRRLGFRDTGYLVLELPMK